MKVEDLGELTGDIVLFGGIYSNLQALHALLDWADHANIGPRNCISTGDIVAYCANPAEVSALMQDTGLKSIAGNCELQLAAGAEDCGCGFDEGSNCDLASKGWFPFAKSRTEVFQGYFATLPDILVFTHNGARYGVIHGGVHDVARFLWPVSSDADFATEIELLEAEIGAVDGVICGHSGVPFERALSDRRWINAGVIGMPPNDGRPQTRFAVLSDDGVRFHHLDYDAAAAATSMRDVGLGHGYDDALVSGVWPSEDVLPPELRR